MDERMPHHLMWKWQMINLWRAKFKYTINNQSDKKYDFWENELHQPEMALSSLSLYAPHMLYACLTVSGHVPDETTDGILGDLLPELDQGISELLGILRYRGVLLDLDGPVSGIKSFILQELPAHSPHEAGYCCAPGTSDIGPRMLC